MSVGGSWVTLEVEGANEMRAWTVAGEGAAKDGRPGLIVFQDAFGVNAHFRNLAERFAAEGFTVIAPELFHRKVTGFDSTDMTQVMELIRSLTTEGLEADARTAHAWLTGPGGCAPTRIAALGFCMGGRTAFVANTALPLAAAVSYYGGGIAEGLLDRVPALSGPQLFFWGGKDARITPEHVRSIEDALRAAGKTYVNVVFSDSQHSFFQDFIPERFDVAAARQSLALALAFLAEHV